MLEFTSNDFLFIEQGIQKDILCRQVVKSNRIFLISKLRMRSLKILAKFII